MGTTEAKPSDFINQAKTVFEHYKNQEAAEAVNFNWMSRGEPLSNSSIINSSQKILIDLRDLADEAGLIAKFNISTILPETLRGDRLATIFNGITPTIYYSLYSMDDSCRKKWMPKSLPVDEALLMLKDYQSQTAKIIKIHSAFIKGENDSEGDILKIADAISKVGLQVDFNIVRYNPFSSKQGEETSFERIEEIAELLSNNISGNVKIIDRVGFDVKASCGMFVENI